MKHRRVDLATLALHKPATGRARLSRRREALVHVVLGTLWLSGVAWLVFHHFLRVPGEFGELPHPLESWWLRLHGAAAFAALWLLGVLWPTHLLPAWRSRRRASGIVLAAFLAVLVASGWLLYYGGEETRGAVSLLHWIGGLALALPLLWHALRGRSARVP